MLKDLTGQKIGMLTVAGIAGDEEGYNRTRYICICDCGNKCIRNHNTLASAISKNRISSCGCFTKKNLRHDKDSERMRKAGLHRKDRFVNGSNLQMTFRTGTIRSNTSGYQGISWSRTAHKWHVYIGYRNYRCNMGFYTDLDTAVKVREQSEDAIKNGTFEDFFLSLRGFNIERYSKYKKGKENGARRKS